MAAFVFVNVKLDTRKLDKLSQSVEKRAEQVLTRAAFGIESDWKDNIIWQNVIDTGAYLNSVGVDPIHRRLERTISDGVEYGVYQEFGWRGHPARPCLLPAVEHQRGALVKAWGLLFQL